MSEVIQYTADDELDFGSLAPQFAARRVNVDITEAEVQAKENGSMAVIRFEGDDLPFAATVTAWLTHTNEKAQQIGNRTMRAIYKAVNGVPKGTVSSLPGRRVSAYAKEDEDGRIQLNSFKAPTDGGDANGTTVQL